MTPTELQEAMKFKNGLIEIRRLARMLLDSEDMGRNTIERVACQIHDDAGKLLGVARP
jgi:hypothetical protein